MLKRFQILQCVSPKSDNAENQTNSNVVAMCSPEDPNIVLYFPIPEEDAAVINYIIDPEKYKDQKPNAKILGLYQTIMSGFESSGTFVSGIVIGFENIDNEDILSCDVHLSLMEGGYLESIMKTTFSNAMVFAAMNDIELFLTNTLFEKLIGEIEDVIENSTDNQDNQDDQKTTQSTQPKNTPIENEKKNKLKNDKDAKKIAKIAKNIMNGKLRK